MATTRKNAAKAPKAAPTKAALSKKAPVKAVSPKAAPQKAAAGNTRGAGKSVAEMSRDELVADNFAALSKVVGTLGATLEMLVQKVESVANHVIATEEILAEVIAANGINLARVNARIRAKIAVGTDNNGSADQAIDVAASIASPLPRR